MTGSKIVTAARRTNVNGSSTHIFRHLCLTDLARADWDIHEIATLPDIGTLRQTVFALVLSYLYLQAHRA